MTRTKTRALANWPNNAVSVLDHGAVGDGVTDDTAAINDAIAYCKSQLANQERSSTGNGVALNLVGGNYLITAPLNLSNIRPGFNFTVFGNGATINADVAGSWALDMIGSKRLVLKDFSIWSSNAKCGIVLGRNSADTADMHSFYNVHVQGLYTLASIYNFASEHVSYYDCFFFNDYDAGSDAYVVINDSFNSFGINSTYTTSTTANQFQSFNASQYRNCKFFRRTFDGNDSLGPCIYMDQGCQKHEYNGCYLVGSKGNGVLIKFRKNGVSVIGGWTELRGLHLDLHMEKYGQASAFNYAIEIDSSEEGDDEVVIHDLVYHDNNPHCSVGIFKVTNNTKVTMINADVSIIDVSTATAPLQFAQALNKLDYIGKIAIPGYASPRLIQLDCFSASTHSKIDVIYRGDSQTLISSTLGRIGDNSSITIYNPTDGYLGQKLGLPLKADLALIPVGALYVDTDNDDVIKRKKP